MKSFEKFAWSVALVAAMGAASLGAYRLGHPAPTPFLNSTVYDSVPSWDGETLYVVGNFTRAQGLVRHRVAAINVETGKVLPDFSVDANGLVTGILEDHVNGYLRITGRFTTVNGVPRLHEAILRESDGALLG